MNQNNATALCNKLLFFVLSYDASVDIRKKREASERKRQKQTRTTDLCCLSNGCRNVKRRERCNKKQEN